ncbi:HEAT repeat domain-containing protein [candidate division KSB1 bacterium]|nr:HEAT repeat domain-containing protein [candidate division KSB1 bacterium]
MEIKNYLSKNWKKLLLRGSLAVLFVLIVVFAGASYIIINEVETICFKTQKMFPGDAVESLTSALKSENLSIREKNQVIWALGEIGDKRAIPVLRTLETGEMCDKPCDTNQKICQYGIRKSIRFCEGINVIRPVWQIIHPS